VSGSGDRDIQQFEQWRFVVDSGFQIERRSFEYVLGERFPHHPDVPEFLGPSALDDEIPMEALDPR
jgi:hypothetical protein